MDEVKIGDFSEPLVAPKKSLTPGAPSGKSPTSERLDAAEEHLGKEAAHVEKSLKPIESYEDRLKAAGIARDKAAAIVDNVLMKGSHTETYPITSRVKLRLRTRTARDTKRIQDFLEVARPAYEPHYNEILWRMSLAASLESLGTDTFQHPSRNSTEKEVEELFQERVRYVDTLPDPTLRLLISKLFKFDEMIRVVLEEGAIENF